MSDNKMQYGWICPVCGRGLSPQTMACPCKDIAELFSPYQIPYPKIYTTSYKYKCYSDWRYIDPTPTTKGGDY